MLRVFPRITPAATGYAVTLALTLSFAVLASSLWRTGDSPTTVATGTEAGLGAAPAGAIPGSVR